MTRLNERPVSDLRCIAFYRGLTLWHGYFSGLVSLVDVSAHWGREGYE
jgi:hypothetical protein